MVYDILIFAESDYKSPRMNAFINVKTVAIWARKMPCDAYWEGNSRVQEN